MKRFDMEGLEWRPAFKRAAFFVALWLVTIYALSTAFPESFYLGLDTSGGILALLANAVLFFFFFTAITAFSERRRRRARGGVNPVPQAKGKPTRTATPENEQADDLKGRQNPNTSRKKASRRRRR